MKDIFYFLSSNYFKAKYMIIVKPFSIPGVGSSSVLPSQEVEWQQQEAEESTLGVQVVNTVKHCNIWRCNYFFRNLILKYNQGVLWHERVNQSVLIKSFGKRMSNKWSKCHFGYSSHCEKSYKCGATNEAMSYNHGYIIITPLYQ